MRSPNAPTAHRRRGVGRAALAFLEAEAATAGRTTAQGDTSWPYGLGPDGTGAPGLEFARRHGYALALGDVQNRLALPVDLPLLDRIDADIAEAARGYSVRSWIGPVPADVVEGWAILDASIDTEAPSGDLDIEPATPDVEGIREQEELLVRQNRLPIGSVALTPDGQVAAYTQLVVSGDDGNAYQWGTLVRGADRGHRLGTAVKIANLRLLQDRAPDAPAVYTYNAESNAHMLAVNTLLGFVPTERMGELQKRLV
ncbi:GNAT family N-acetyltransferase [Microbacterium aurugineum]